MFSCHVLNEFTALILGDFVGDVTNPEKAAGQKPEKILGNLSKVEFFRR
jgi:hypothetical protein